MPVLIEAAVDSAAAAERAVLEGASRLEVCARLDFGGLTPSIQLLRECLTLGVPSVAMARPRAGEFIYTSDDLAQLLADAAALRDAGAHGIVFGALASNRTIDESTVRSVVQVCDGIDSVFHRAFDDTPDAREALDILIACHVTRVLTSGHAATAADGVVTLAALTEQAARCIEVLPGGGIRAHNVQDIVRLTGATQVHARGTEPGVIEGIKLALGAI